MGGYGSGRQYVLNKKNVVEDYKNIDINLFKRKNVIQDGCFSSGSLTWTRNGNYTGSIGYETHLDKKPPYIRLFYTYNKTADIDYT